MSANSNGITKEQPQASEPRLGLEALRLRSIDSRWVIEHQEVSVSVVPERGVMQPLRALPVAILKHGRPIAI